MRAARPGPLARGLVAAVLALVAVRSAIPSSKPEAAWTVTAPASVRQGEVAVVDVRSDVAIASGSASLAGPSGSTVARATGFRATEAGGRFVILIPIPTTLAPGVYSIETSIELADGAPILSTGSLAVEAVAYPSEDVQLNAANTAIRTDASPERLEQIRALSELLATVDQGAPRFAGPFIAPVDSTRRTSLFGDRRRYIRSDGKAETTIHYGIDFGIPTGTPVRSTGAGRVAFAGNRISTGFTAVVEHLPGVYSLYYHLSALSVTAGQEIAAGAPIGFSGSTGLSTGPHLHWEMRVNGEAVSPDWFVERALY